jgi:hypothetical protein
VQACARQHRVEPVELVEDRVGRAVERARLPAAIEEIDISGDADLEARYGLEIPVLLVNGRKAAKYRITEGELRRLLAARSTSP